jgi:excisionase family DNA binding protein
MLLPALLSLRDVASTLNVSMSTVRRLIENDSLPVIRIGRSLRVDPDDLADWIDAHVDQKVA